MLWKILAVGPARCARVHTGTPANDIHRGFLRSRQGVAASRAACGQRGPVFGGTFMARNLKFSTFTGFGVDVACVALRVTGEQSGGEALFDSRRQGRSDAAKIQVKRARANSRNAREAFAVSSERFHGCELTVAS